MNGAAIPLIPNCSICNDDWSLSDSEMNDQTFFKIEMEFHFIGMRDTIINPTATYNL